MGSGTVWRWRFYRSLPAVAGSNVLAAPKCYLRRPAPLRWRWRRCCSISSLSTKRYAELHLSVSTANAFVLRGAKIVFVDVRPDTMNIDER
ncbi:hypothetical protein ACNKHV_24050 [Shigella flexneri]